ncbi:DNA polymerase lambda-like [Centruroides sculpturatus]|uniref:DNA polymerase lambda-like n=1 Tax=Centruroides sculpturatus TaxID=218467 RepID=UPI000C6EB432|nr:DNA polymerase lambda-like [Centruroides sculpturatus]
MSELFFSDLKFYILPTGIGKVRKEIFENQIKKHGGHVVNKVFEATHLIIEDSLDRCKLEKFVNEKDVRNLEIIKSLWLSKCFEQRQLIDSDSYKLKCSVIRKDDDLIDCCKRQKVENECSLSNTENNHIQDSGFSSENTSPIKNQDLNSQNWVCSYSSKSKPTNYNKHIIEKLEILAETYKNTKDHWRSFGYQKALLALRNYPKPITNYEEALSLPGIGKSLANKIWEIIESGHLRKIDEICSGQKVEAINLFTKIWGAGPTTAEQWVQQGLYTLEDLNSKAKLSFQQKIGLKYFDDFLDRMPREEAKEIAETVKSVALSFNPDLIVEACGSYRRGKQTCGDLDILITHADGESHKSILSDLINKLHEEALSLPGIGKSLANKIWETYKNTKDHWRSFGYQKALLALRNYPKPITNYEEALSLPGIGKSLANKIWEIIESGHLRKIDEICSGQKVEAINLFTKIWGAGPTTAEQWVQQGLYTLEDLNSKAKLSFQQKIGLKYFDDFLDRMPREEAKEIAETVKSVALSFNPDLIVEACGSYRRGKQTCGDLDILITHADGESHKSILSDLINKLHEQGFLTDDLVKNGEYGTHTKYLGVCKLNGDDKKHRRIDIITVPYNELACAMLYFTGSAHFNRSMRLLARKKGMALSEHSLRAGVIRRGGEKICEGYVLPTPTEESVFEHLGLTYRIPEERDH